MLAEKVYHSRQLVDNRYVLKYCLIIFKEILPDKGKTNILPIQICTKSIEIDQTAIINLIPTSFPLKHFFIHCLMLIFTSKSKYFWMQNKQTNNSYKEIKINAQKFKIHC